MIQFFLQITSFFNARASYSFSRSKFLKDCGRCNLPSLWKPVSCLFLLLSLVSCTSEDEHLHKQVQQILSWSASAEMILDARLGLRVPQGFTDLAVERCRKQISDLSTELPQTSEDGQAKAVFTKLDGLIAAVHDEISSGFTKLDGLIAAVHDEISSGHLEEGRRHLADLHRFEVQQRSAFGADG